MPTTPIYPALEVIELVPGRTTGVVTLRSTVYNQRSELVPEGMQKLDPETAGLDGKPPAMQRNAHRKGRRAVR